MNHGIFFTGESQELCPRLRTACESQCASDPLVLYCHEQGQPMCCSQFDIAVCAELTRAPIARCAFRVKKRACAAEAYYSRLA